MPKPKQLKAVLTHDGTTWHAAVKGDRHVRATGHNTRTARAAAAMLAREKFGDDVEIEFEVHLPEPLRTEMDAWLAQDRKLAEENERHSVKRSELAVKLLSAHLTQAEAAEFFGTSQNHLAMILKRRAAGRPVTTRTGRVRKKP